MVGGTWPDTTTELPAGAAFTDHGDGKGAFRWTPDATGFYTVSFLARDFTGRRDGTWNTVQTATYQVFDPQESNLLTLAVQGVGTVHSSTIPTTTDINCSGSSCSAAYATGTLVTLSAIPVAEGTFIGWSGACSGTGSCEVPMNQTQDVGVEFTNPYFAQIGTTGFTTLGAAYAAAASGSTIKVQGKVMNESLLVNRNIAIILAGGYDSALNTQEGYTTLQQLTVTAGTVTVDRLGIQ